MYDQNWKQTCSSQDTGYTMGSYEDCLFGSTKCSITDATIVGVCPIIPTLGMTEK